MSRYLNRLIPSSIGTVVDESGRCLMIRRTKDPYVGRWAMPGGKIEVGEHPDAAILREFEEETGLTTAISQFCGVVSEIIPVEGGISHFLMYVFRLSITGGTLQESEEGPLSWLTPAEIQKEGIPSDAFITSELLFVNEASSPHLVNLTSNDHDFTIHASYR